MRLRLLPLLLFAALADKDADSEPAHEDISPVPAAVRAKQQKLYKEAELLSDKKLHSDRVEILRGLAGQIVKLAQQLDEVLKFEALQIDDNNLR